MNEHEVGDPYLFYYLLRFKARERAVVALNKRIVREGQEGEWRGLTLASIDREAIEYAGTVWRRSYGPRTHYGFVRTWDELYHDYAPRPAHFGVAVWQTIEGRRVLQALGLGRPSSDKSVMSLDWVEKSFAPDYCLRGALLPILMAFEEYARLVGSAATVIKHPVDPGQFYRYGYTVSRRTDKSGAYLFKEVLR
jgi:hypothetical protein